MKVEVVCYSGYKGDERPVRFRLGGQDYFVEELLDQWYGPQDVFFKVRANDGNVYILRRSSRCLKVNGAWNRSVTCGEAAERKCYGLDPQSDVKGRLAPLRPAPSEQPAPMFGSHGPSSDKTQPSALSLPGH